MKHGLILSGYDSFHYINLQGNKIHLNLHYIPSAVASKKYSVRDENNEGEKALVEKLSSVTAYSVLGSAALRQDFSFCCFT